MDFNFLEYYMDKIEKINISDISQINDIQIPEIV